MKKIYLCMPYSHPEIDRREARFRLSNQLAARLIEKGFNVLSPISHSHPIAEFMNNHNDSNFWTRLDIEWIKHCDEMFVANHPAWRSSKGIAKEIQAAIDLGIPVRLVDLTTGGVICDVEL